MKCTSAIINGSVSWGYNHRVGGCTSLQRDSDQTSNIYEFDKRPCNKLTGPGVQAQLSEKKQSRNGMASQLRPNDWVVFKSTGDEDQHIWPGRTLSNRDWDNECIWRNDGRGRVEIDGALISPGGYAINVQWQTQKVIGALDYVIEGGENAQTFVQSNKDLVLTGFDDHMHQVIGAQTRAPRQQTSDQINWKALRAVTILTGQVRETSFIFLRTQELSHNIDTIFG